MIICTDTLKALLTDVKIQVTFYLIIFDIFTGIIKSFKSKTLKSNVGINGLIKHSLVIILILSMGMFSEPFKLEVIFNGLVVFYIVQYLISIVENLYILGVPIPESIVEKLFIYRQENPEYIVKIENGGARK